jgi:hypothetical protein
VLEMLRRQAGTGVPMNCQAPFTSEASLGSSAAEKCCS